tara:strand:+ start:45 stop:278 length:234 start_codon:yes stop_codon:yes gene_type:complete
MTNAFSKTFGCITKKEMDELIENNKFILCNHNIMRERCFERGSIDKNEYREISKIMILREALYLVFGFKPNRVLLVN